PPETSTLSLHDALPICLDDFDYHLPGELIAQHPLPERDASRLMVLDRATQTIEDRDFRELPQILEPGDLLVFNNTKVFPARLLGDRKSTRLNSSHLVIS